MPGRIFLQPFRSLTNAVREGACELKLLADGTPYVTDCGHIRINVKQDPCVGDAVKDVYNRVATHPSVNTVTTVCEQVAATQPTDPTDICITTAANLIPRVLNGLRQLLGQ
jgi:hypothetical protein